MEPHDNGRLGWGFPKKFALRTFYVYVLLYALSHPFGVPFGDTIEAGNDRVWDEVVPWVGAQVVRLSYPITVRPAGSGDTTYNYVQILAMLALALALGLLWAYADRKRNNDAKLFSWFTVALRYYLACVMLTYGFAKVIKTQFPFPGLDSLIQPFGDSSPMGLLWNFMGFSTPYTIFAGLGEVVAGLLLFFRRTTTLGALVTIGVMANVAMLNFSYDVPVKLFSSHLLVFAFFLLALDLRRVLDVFILNRAAAPAPLDAHFRRAGLNRGGLAFKAVFIGFVLYSQISGGLELNRRWGTGREKPPLYGIYNVDTFVQNGDTLAPLLTDSLRWRRLVVDWPGFATVRRMNDGVARYAFYPDTTAGSVQMYTFADTSNKFTLHYKRPAPEELTFEGVLHEDSVYIQMSAYDVNNFLLVNRGFHWINETPFNR